MKAFELASLSAYPEFSEVVDEYAGLGDVVAPSIGEPVVSVTVPDMFPIGGKIDDSSIVNVRADHSELLNCM